MEIKLRQERVTDHDAISEAIIASYENVEYSNHREQIMVERLRNSKAFVPELSIVAELDERTIVGHILLTRIQIIKKEKFLDALVLAPLSIRPEYQNIGIGKRLVMESHRVARGLGFEFVTVLGHADYYPKFGYGITSKYNIEIPYKISEANSMIIDLSGNDFSSVINGKVKYSDEFFE
ncbi:GNAT family N-acetyltransferase [Dyadobacter subterraneus]|uniref:N-acetyltransferase n=1 Tax=Dyadobacter subterraneus TaxID=2773304 RepID=A0ABR9WBB4_9BACT|nr:N-acetyltransferase [Dyadobacter subterraneus]MBE9461646.1 N-acetyltransferase [Dyadobacter subterraneus]